MALSIGNLAQAGNRRLWVQEFAGRLQNLTYTTIELYTRNTRTKDCRLQTTDCRTIDYRTRVYIGL